MNLKYTERDKAILLLEDGTVVEGKAIGYRGIAGGEICFNTGMTGYQEVYTDPSYYGQIVINTTSHIGNYGVKGDEEESEDPKINGLIVNAYSQLTSRSTADDSLDGYLNRHTTVGISDVDTRKLVRHIRSKGAMNCLISSTEFDLDVLKTKLGEVPSMESLELATRVSTAEAYLFGAETSSYKVAVLDLGIKKSILKNFAERDCFCKVFPAKTDFQTISDWGADAYFISNGPGDPAAMDYAVETVKAILDSGKPLFGICLGHQVISRALGISTFKMHHGHRGLNHPVKNIVNGKSEITSQNHGFAVSKSDVENAKAVELTHINLNDDTVEGIRLIGKPVYSVQYHPESSPGPHDSRYLFDDFIELIKTK